MDKITLILFFGIFFSIYVSASSAEIGMPNIEQGDGIWGTINVDTPGLVSVNTWTDGSSYDGIRLYLYNETGNQVASNYQEHQTSIDYPASTTGTYTVKAYLSRAYGGGKRTISVSSNHQLSLMPKYNKIVFDIAQGNAVWHNLRGNSGDLIFINVWTNGSSYDGIGLYLYNKTGNQVASNYQEHQTSINYIAPKADTYTVKAYLGKAYGGGKRTISVSSNFPFENSNPASTLGYSIINIKKSSETAPDISIDRVIKQNLNNATTLLSGSARSESGIKSVFVNGIYAGDEHWSVNISGSNNIVIVATSKDGNITTENISLTTDTSGLLDTILAFIGVVLALVGLLFGKQLSKFGNELIKKFKKYRNG